MISRRAVWAVALAAVLAPSPAEAKYSLQGTLSLAVGWNSNINATDLNIESDFTSTLAAGLTFASALPRLIQTVTYNFAAQLYFQHEDLTSYSNSLLWSAIALTSPNTTMRLTLGVSQSQVNSIVNTPGSGATPIAVTTIGNQQFVQVNGSEGFNWDFHKSARLTQSLALTVFLPLVTGTGQTYSLTNSLILDRSFRLDAFAGELQITYTDFTEAHGPVTNADGSVNPNGVVSPEQQQLYIVLVFRWRRDFGHFWNTQLDAGAVAVMRASDGGGFIAQPQGLAAIRYLHPRTQLDLTYSHSVSPDPLTQQTLSADTVALRSTVPFGVKSRVGLTSSVGYAHSRIVDTNQGTLGGGADVVLVDASLNWTPLDWLGVFTRYSFNKQYGDASSAISNFSRHVILVGITGTYPTRAAAVVPGREALRVDRSDVEAFPDVHSEPTKQ